MDCKGIETIKDALFYETLDRVIGMELVRLSSYPIVDAKDRKAAKHMAKYFLTKEEYKQAKAYLKEENRQ